ncbi:DUF2911 domain-containing protein [Maribacter algarum]|uniref:DUF2911 domain-containing protein n=1 Tax=Maribacter algarum (ex Zhang et al. 2020) TaxID=2578118 RepID=A0A5S3PNC8_9FLAO|nr:DUF2911 domain-containing protein [Maribacter algarum]TMM55982.1 DUF2911 domain-containing protein [Maribacter algarum]
MKKVILLFFLFVGLYGSAQLNHPKASPAATVTQEVGFTTIKVDYSRPAVRGRKVFGNLPDGKKGLVPYGRIWRVGANESTKITVDTDVSILGNTLIAGTYALYAFPEENEWEVVFHKNTTHWGDGRNNYNAEEDAFRVRIKPNSKAGFQENLLISFDNISHNVADMIWSWENTQVVIPITVNTKGIMEEQIEKALQPGPSAQTYYEAARYYVEQGIKYPEALTYLNKALELGGDTYYFHRVKSLAEAALKDYKSAIKSAQKSLEIADGLGKDEFVLMNQKNIDLWKGKLKD